MAKTQDLMNDSLCGLSIFEVVVFESLSFGFLQSSQLRPNSVNSKIATFVQKARGARFSGPNFSRPI